MNRMAIILMAVLLAASAVLPVLGEGGGNNPAMISSYNVSPPVLSPGGFGVITVEIKQIGRTAMSEKYTSGGSTVTMSWDDTLYVDHIDLEGNGLELISPEYDRIGEIGAVSPLKATFIVRAPKESRIYFPEVWMDSSAGPIRFPIPVNVNSAIGIPSEAIIVMQSLDSGVVKMGDDIPVRLTFRNVGGTVAEKVRLQFGNVTGGIAPKTASMYYLGTISPGEEKTLDITLISNEDADPGLVNVPVTIHYTVADGTIKKEPAFLNLIMRGTPELGIMSVETRPGNVTEKQPFDLILQIENSGTGTAKQVLVTIDLPMNGIKQSDIGKIPAGKDEAAVFLMDGGAVGLYRGNATITYRDDSGIHTGTRQFSLRISRDYNPMLIFGILAVIIIGGALTFVILRKRSHT
jgi:hypothetical protein